MMMPWVAITTQQLQRFHYIICIEIIIRKNNNPTIYRFIYKKADWTKYQTIYKTIFNDLELKFHDPISTHNDFCS